MLDTDGQSILLKFSIFFLSFLLAVNGLIAGQTISGDIGSYNQKEIILYEFFGAQVSPLDTAEIASGKFEFKFKKSLPRGFYRLGRDPKNNRIFILAEDELNIKSTNGSLMTAKIEGSKENAIFADYQKVVRSNNKAMQSINDRVAGIKDLQKTDPGKYNIELQKIKLDFDTTVVWQHAQYRRLSDENPNTFVGKISGYFAKGDNQSPLEYLDLERLNDDELLRGDMFKTKYMIYYQQFLGSNYKSLKANSNTLISNTDIKGRGKEIIYCTIIETFAQADAEYAGTVAKAYLKEFPKSSTANYYFNALPKGPPDVGDDAPDIMLENPDGTLIALSSLRGQIVLLDFWASWCGPCRRENPNVVRTYNEYKDQGFTVYSVSLDNSKEKWVAAIGKDGLAWDNHVSDLKGWRSQGAALYGVRSIPATFLVDQNGVIIAKNLRGSRLENKLKEILGAN